MTGRTDIPVEDRLRASLLASADAAPTSADLRQAIDRRLSRPARGRGLVAGLAVASVVVLAVVVLALPGGDGGDIQLDQPTGPVLQAPATEVPAPTPPTPRPTPTDEPTPPTPRPTLTDEPTIVPMPQPDPNASVTIDQQQPVQAVACETTGRDIVVRWADSEVTIDRDAGSLQPISMALTTDGGDARAAQVVSDPPPADDVSAYTGTFDPTASGGVATVAVEYNVGLGLCG